MHVPPSNLVFFSVCNFCGQDDEEEQRAATSKKSTKSKKKAAFNPFDEIETGGAGGDDSAGGGQDDYNPFADFMAGVRTIKRHNSSSYGVTFLRGRSPRAGGINGRIPRPPDTTLVLII